MAAVRIIARGTVSHLEILSRFKRRPYKLVIYCDLIDMNDTTPISPDAANVEMRDYTSRFSRGQRKTVATTLNERGFSEVLHIVTNEGDADVFLYTVQQDGPMFAVGKGKGKFFLALLRTGEVLGTGRGLTEVLEQLPEASAEEAEDE